MPINLSGSLVLTGSLTVTGGITMSGSIASASYALSSSYAANADLLDNRDSSTFANTGSNIFSDGQYLSSSFNPTGFSTTASLYTDGGLRVTRDAYISGTLYLNNVTVYGTQSVCFITSSQLNISNNLISVNTSTPSVRFGGLAVYDSGSTGLTGSILWDSENNHWVYSNPSGSSYSGGMFISGPRTSTLGSETGTTSCMLLAGQGGDHLTSSMIYHSSTATCIPGALLSSGCIGIGTTTPGYVLDTVGSPVRFSRSGKLILINPNFGSACTNADIQTDSGMDLTFTTSGAEKMRISCAGVVGIGTNSAVEADGTLVVAGCVGTGQGTANTVAQINIWETTSGNKSGLWFGSMTNANTGVIGSRTATGNIAFQTYCGAWAERMRITYNGNVGIGTNSPNAMLDVYTSQGGSTIAASHGTGGSYPKSSGIVFGAVSTALTVCNNGGTTVFFGGAGIYANNSASSNNPTDLIMWTTSGGVAAEKMRITSGGNVGIGTINPAYTLDVNGTGRFTSSGLFCGNLQTNGALVIGNQSCAGIYFLNITPSATGPVALQGSLAGVGIAAISLQPSGGNVGIGTCTPDEKFVVAESTNPSQISLKQLTNFNGGLIGQLNFIGGGTTAKSAMIESCRVGGSATNAFRGGDLRFYTKVDDTFDCLVERIRITNAGDVGIGIASTGTNVKLKVKASSEGSGISLSSATFVIARQATDTQLGIGYYTTPGAWVISSTYGSDGAYQPLAFATSDVERMRITSAGSVGIGTTCMSTEANLFLGAQGTVEGGQLVLQKGTSCSCATHLDNYQDSFRIMSGTNTGSTAVNMSINHANGAATFSSSVTAGGRVIGTGFKNYSGEISIASGVASTIYTMGDNGLYTVQIIAAGGSLIYSAAAIFYAHHSNSQYIKTLDLYDGANVTLDNSGNLIRITNQGFTTLTWNWSIIFQAF